MNDVVLVTLAIFIIYLNNYDSLIFIVIRKREKFLADDLLYCSYLTTHRIEGFDFHHNFVEVKRTGGR